VSLEIIWAPWRLGYVAGNEPRAAHDPLGVKLPPGADPQCFICRAAAEGTASGTNSAADRRNLVVAHDPLCITILNRYPYNNGHLLVAPLRHRARLDELSAEELLACQQALAAWTARLERLMRPDGFNVGLNLGRVAGAGIPGHLHWHLVPRWQGDTNFMPVAAGAKVIPQSLESLWEMLYQGPEPRDASGT
jgi:ATP adenylyltransferase